MDPAIQKKCSVEALLDALVRPPVDLLLLSPPAFLPTAPHLGLALVDAAAVQCGLDARACDLNLASYLHFLSPATVGAAGAALDRVDSVPASLARLFRSGVERGLEDALAVVRDPERSLRIHDLTRAHRVLDRALQIVSAAYSSVDLSMAGCGFGPDASRIDTLPHVIDDPDRNPYVRLADDWFATASSAGPRITGISICYFSQLVPALTIAAAARRRWPHTLLLLGGNLVAILGDRLPGLFKAFTFLDAAARFDGESVIERLPALLAGTEGFESFPGLVWRDSDRIYTNELAAPSPIDPTPVPRFEAAPLEAYLSAHPVLPVALGRGCTWGRCLFCDSRNEYAGTCRTRPAARAADDMVALSERHGVSTFTIVDEAIPFDRLSELAASLLDRGASVQYRVHARFERRPVPASAWDRIRRSGCRRIQFGLESGSSRVIAAMRKGFTVRDASRMLRSAATADVWTHVFLMVGFPGETDADVEETVAFLEQNRPWIGSASVTTFELPWRLRNDPAWRRLGVSPISPTATSLDWRVPRRAWGGAPTTDRVGRIHRWIRESFPEIALKGHDVTLAILAASPGPIAAIVQSPSAEDAPACEPGASCIVSVAPGVRYVFVDRPPGPLDTDDLEVARYQGFFPSGQRPLPFEGRCVVAWVPDEDRLCAVPASWHPLLKALEAPLPVEHVLDLATLAEREPERRVRARALWINAIHDLAAQGVLRTVGCTKAGPLLGRDFLASLAPEQGR